MSREGQLFLASFVVMGVRKKTNVPDQYRIRLVISGKGDEEMRSRIKAFADGLGAMVALEPIEKLDDLAGLPESIRRACKKDGFVLAAMADQPNCS